MQKYQAAWALKALLYSHITDIRVLNNLATFAHWNDYITFCHLEYSVKEVSVYNRKYTDL